MIVGTGVDLAEVDRIRKSIERYGARFIERIFTPGEIAYVERKANKYERYAARFAAILESHPELKSRLNDPFPGGAFGATPDASP